MAASIPSQASRQDEPDAGEEHLWLSALADGDGEALARATALWRQDAGARERWYTYHLIGDLMRSQELASTPARDAEFLVGLRARLASEPVPMAPTPPRPAHMGLQRLGWRAPAAVAAGVATVAAALVLTRPSDAPPEGAAPGIQLVLGEAGSPQGGGLRVRSIPAPAAGGPLVADRGVIRDVRLDAYLRAHEAARGNAPAATPGGGLRNAEIVVTPMPASSFASEPR
jgi:sigma-E factor negative regulatory protein RseA